MQEEQEGQEGRIAPKGVLAPSSVAIEMGQRDHSVQSQLSAVHRVACILTFLSEIDYLQHYRNLARLDAQGVEAEKKRGKNAEREEEEERKEEEKQSLASAGGPVSPARQRRSSIYDSLALSVEKHRQQLAKPQVQPKTDKERSSDQAEKAAVARQESVTLFEMVASFQFKPLELDELTSLEERLASFPSIIPDWQEIYPGLKERFSELWKILSGDLDLIQEAILPEVMDSYQDFAEELLKELGPDSESWHGSVQAVLMGLREQERQKPLWTAMDSGFFYLVDSLTAVLLFCDPQDLLNAEARLEHKRYLKAQQKELERRQAVERERRRLLASRPGSPVLSRAATMAWGKTDPEDRSWSSSSGDDGLETPVYPPPLLKTDSMRRIVEARRTKKKFSVFTRNRGHRNALIFGFFLLWLVIFGILAIWGVFVRQASFVTKESMTALEAESFDRVLEGVKLWSEPAQQILRFHSDSPRNLDRMADADALELFLFQNMQLFPQVRGVYAGFLSGGFGGFFNSHPSELADRIAEQEQPFLEPSRDLVRWWTDLVDANGNAHLVQSEMDFHDDSAPDFYQPYSLRLPTAPLTVPQTQNPELLQTSFCVAEQEWFRGALQRWIEHHDQSPEDRQESAELGFPGPEPHWTQDWQFSHPHGHPTVTVSVVMAGNPAPGQALEADPLVAEALAAEPFLGVLGVDLSLEDLSSLIGRANLWSSSRALVVDEFWNLIASSNGHFDVSGIAESEDPLLKGVLEYFRGGYSLPDGARDDGKITAERGWSTEITRFGLDGRPFHVNKVDSLPGLDSDVLLFTSAITLLPRRSFRIIIAVREHDYLDDVYTASMFTAVFGVLAAASALVLSILSARLIMMHDAVQRLAEANHGKQGEKKKQKPSPDQDSSSNLLASPTAPMLAKPSPKRMMTLRLHNGQIARSQQDVRPYATMRLKKTKTTGNVSSLIPSSELSLRPSAGGMDGNGGQEQQEDQRSSNTMFSSLFQRSNHKRRTSGEFQDFEDGRNGVGGDGGEVYILEEDEDGMTYDHCCSVFGRSFTHSQGLKCGVFTALCAIICLVTSIWIVWGFLSPRSLSSVSHRVTSAARSRVLDSVHSEFDHRNAFLLRMQELHLSATEQNPDLSTADLSVLDNFFMSQFVGSTLPAVMDSHQDFFKTGDGSLPDGISRWLVSNVYFAEESSGGIIGAGVRNPGSPDDMEWFIGAADPSNAFCYTQYALDKDPGRTEPFQRDIGVPPLFQDPGCLYDPRERPWYQETVAAGTLTWSSVYQFHTTGSLGITLGLPLYSEVTEALLGVYALDIQLEHLAWFQHEHSHVDSSPDAVAFLLRRDGMLISASDLNHLPPFQYSDLVQPAEFSELEILAETAVFLSNTRLGLQGIREGFPKRAFMDPLTGVRSYDGTPLQLLSDPTAENSLTQLRIAGRQREDRRMTLKRNSSLLPPEEHSPLPVVTAQLAQQQLEILRELPVGLRKSLTESLKQLGSGGGTENPILEAMLEHLLPAGLRPSSQQGRRSDEAEAMTLESEAMLLSTPATRDTLQVAGVDILSVVSLPSEEFLAEFDREETFAFLICAGAMIVLLYVLVNSFYSFQRQILTVSSDDDLMDELAEENVQIDTLTKLMRKIRPLILEACATAWHNEHSSDDGESDLMRKPVRMEDLQRHYQRTAIRLIDDSRTARNILTLCSIQIAADLRGSAEHQLNPRRSIFGIKMERTSQWPVRFYRFLTGTHYRIFYNLVLWTHVFLAFAEPDTLDDLQGKSVDDPYIFDFLRRLIVCCSSVCLSFRTMCSGVKASVLALEAVCLFIEALDIVFFMTVKYQWQTFRFDSLLSDGNSFSWDVVYVVLVFLCCIDWFAAAIGRVSIEYFFPIRPFFLILRNRSVLNYTKIFFKTLWEARHVFLLWLTTVLIAAVMGTLLFRKIVEVSGVESSYLNFIRALTTSFTYITTGENYLEVVYPTVSESPWYAIYFFVFTLMGMIFVIAMVVGIFENGFDELRKGVEREEALFLRTGMIGAFILLDLDGNETLSRDEVTGFLQALRPDMGEDGPQMCAELFDRMNKEKGKDLHEILSSGNREDAGQDAEEHPDDVIDIAEFVTSIEEISFHRLVKVQRPPTFLPGLRKTIKHGLLERRSFALFQLLTVMANVWCASLYGSYTVEKNLDYLLSAFVWWYSIELVFRIGVYGWNEFWNYEVYHGPNDHNAHSRMMMHRSDFVIIAISFIGFIVCYIIAGWEARFDDGEDSLRFVMTFPLLRLFILIESIRDLVFTLILMIPQFISVLILMFVLFMVYAVIGVWLFADEWSEVLQDEAPEGNFDTLSNAMLSLFQLLVGEGWHELMYAGVLVKGGFGATWYFISFIIIVSMLFTNLFVGMVLNAFQQQLEVKEERKKASKIEKMLLRRRLRDMGED